MKSKGRLTIGEAAAALGTHRNAIGRWIASGKLSARREGRTVYIEATDLRAFLLRTCPVCSKSFEAEDARQAYCGDRCKWTARNRRAALRRKATPDRTPPPPPDPAKLRRLVAAVTRRAHLLHPSPKGEISGL